jgi:hypothetical protein
MDMALAAATPLVTHPLTLTSSQRSWFRVQPPIPHSPSNVQSPLPHGSPPLRFSIRTGAPIRDLAEISSPDQLFLIFLSEGIFSCSVLWQMQILARLFYCGLSSPSYNWWSGLGFQCGLYFRSGVQVLSVLQASWVFIYQLQHFKCESSVVYFHLWNDGVLIGNMNS